MTFLLAVLGVLGAAEVVRLEAARVVSGQRVCLGDPQRPCYKIAYFHAVSSRVSFVEAREACQMDGGSLLSIESAGEQSDIQHLLQALRLGAAEMAGGGGSIADGDFWIGLRRVDGDERTRAELGGAGSTCPQLYQWSDGSAAAFRNWYSDEPSCGGEACVVMYHQPTAAPGLGGAYLYQWNDDRCNMKHNFICKYEPESHLLTEHGDTPGGPRGAVTAGGGVVTAADRNGPPRIVEAGASGMLLLYVIIPTIPLLLLILMAAGTCCFQMLSQRTPRTKTTAPHSNLWIPASPKSDTMEV